ncbi:hypothetical protein BH23PLA1_BH23PLA1_01650 [soil metagenome]
MVPLGPEGIEHALSWLAPAPLASRLHLRHALIERRPGLWGDQGRRPSSVVWLRDGDGQREALGDGDPAPAVVWLAEQSGAIALLAPQLWEAEVLDTFGEAEVGTGTVITRRYTPRDIGPDRLPTALASPNTSGYVRPLGPGDAAAFVAMAPPWALRAWGSFRNRIDGGAGAVVPAAGGLAAIAWVLAADDCYEAVGIYTSPKFRQLGLGRAAASALIRQIVTDHRRMPLWTTAAENTASLALASSLGLRAALSETLHRRPAPATSR